MKFRTVTVLALALVVPAAANFKVATIGLDTLVKQSEVIVIAEVTEIVTRAGVKVAVAKVFEGVKSGSPTGTIEFVAERTWTCDTSNAVVGERVLLYLGKVRKDSRITMLKQDLGKAASESRNGGRVLYVLAHHGRGRLVLKERSGAWMVPIWRWTKNEAWKLNVNLKLPNGMGIHSIEPLKGHVALADVVTSTLNSLRAKGG